MKRPLAAATIVLLAVASGGCGRDPGVDPVFRRAAAATKGAATARFEVAARTGQPTTGDTPRLADGVVDFAKRNRSMSLAIPGSKVEIRVVDGATFMRAEGGQIAEATEGMWQQEPTPSPGQLTPMTRVFAGFGGDPIEVLDAERGVRDGKEMGNARIRGVITKRHHFAFDPVDVLPELRRKAATYGVEEKLIRDKTSGEMQLWIDDADRIRRMVYTAKSDRGSPMEVNFYVLTEFYDFGSDAGVTAPPRQDVRFVIRPPLQEVASSAAPSPVAPDVRPQPLPTPER